MVSLVCEKVRIFSELALLFYSDHLLKVRVIVVSGAGGVDLWCWFRVISGSLGVSRCRR